MPGKISKRTAKKASPTKNTDLEKRVSGLEAELARTKKALTKSKTRVHRWRKEAQANKKSASKALARVEKLGQKLDESRAVGEPVSPAASAVPPAASAAPKPVSQPRAKKTTVNAVALPDETWSVVQLRAEARGRGLAGMSNKTKAQLLAALS